MLFPAYCWLLCYLIILYILIETKWNYNNVMNGELCCLLAYLFLCTSSFTSKWTRHTEHVYFILSYPHWVAIWIVYFVHRTHALSIECVDLQHFRKVFQFVVYLLSIEMFLNTTKILHCISCEEYCCCKWKLEMTVQQNKNTKAVISLTPHIKRRNNRNVQIGLCWLCICSTFCFVISKSTVCDLHK